MRLRLKCLCSSIAMLSACGTYCGEGQPASSVFPAETAAVEACTGLAGADNINVRLEPTMRCPTSGRECCLASKGVTPCNDGTDDLCGYAGLFVSDCNLIRLPDKCTDAFRHELIHALLRANGKPWHGHDGAVWDCQ